MEITEQISDIIFEYRLRAKDTTFDLMTECFSILGGILAGADISALPTEPVCGISPDTLKILREKAPEEYFNMWLSCWADASGLQAYLEFMDFNSLNREAFRAKFPRAYKKWTDEEDEELMRVYKDAEQYFDKSEGKFPKEFWNNLSDRFRRNQNAVKLRLVKLGADLGPDSPSAARY